MRTWVIAVALAVLAILIAAGSSPAFYQWTDEKGQLHVTDYPKPGGAAPAPEPAQKPAQEQPAPAAPAPAPSAPPTVLPSATVIPVKSPALPPAPAAGAEQKSAVMPAPQVRPGAASAPTVTPASQATLSAPSPQPAAPVPVKRTVQVQPQPRADAAALVAGFGFMLLLVGAAAYLYASLCLFLIARKLNVAAPWIAWVPLIQVFTLVSCASKPAWWVLLFLVPVVNVIVSIYLWICITENLGREKWFGLLMLVPVVNLAYMGVLAFAKKE